MTTYTFSTTRPTFADDPARMEQQRLALIYNVGERQMQRCYQIASRLPGDPGANLLSLLERRLDNLVLRAGFADSIFAARQIVTRHHVLVNGKIVSGAGQRLRPGEVITLRPRNSQPLEILRWGCPTVPPPPYLAVDFSRLVAMLVRSPLREEIPTDIDDALVAKFYARAM